MHEGHFTEEIVRVILKEVQSKAAGKPKSIKVRVGEMLHLEPESVRMHFEMLTQNTELKDAELILEETSVLVRCRKCGQEGGILDHHLLMCQTCDSSDVQILSGDEVVIEQIELETV